MKNAKRPVRRGSFLVEILLIFSIMITVTGLFVALTLQIRRTQQAVIAVEEQTSERLRLAQDLRRDLHRCTGFQFLSSQEIEAKREGVAVRYTVLDDQVHRHELETKSGYEIAASGSFEFNAESGLLVFSIPQMRMVIVPEGASPP